MFRIRRIHDEVGPANVEAIARVEQILKDQLPGLAEAEIAQVRGQLRNPLKYGFRSILFVAEGRAGQVSGSALVSHEPDLYFAYLDFIATTRRMTSRGIGGALYNRVREEARALDAVGLFFECLPDDPKLSPQPQARRQNAARLRFYEGFGARPVVNTAYETPFKPGTNNPPYLVYDRLGRAGDLPRDHARTIVRAILDLKYGDKCPPGYVDMVVQSFQDDPVRLRAPRYETTDGSTPVGTSVPDDERILLVVNDRHSIHHVRRRGYVEAPVRIATIKNELDRTGLFHEISPHRFPKRHILSVHETELIEYMQRMCETLEPGKSVYPYVFHPASHGGRPDATFFGIAAPQKPSGCRVRERRRQRNQALRPPPVVVPLWRARYAVRMNQVHCRC